MTGSETGKAGRPRPWMIAAWPGMGSVASLAAGYLVRELGMQEAGEFPHRGHFDIHEVAVKDGLVLPVRVPRGHFFRWRNPGEGRDLVVFLAEAQPPAGVWHYANELLDAAATLGIERVATFASMASALHPSADPKVTGIATDAAMLGELRKAEVTLLDDGQVGGLNGVLLAAAAERGVPGLGLLGEIPFFASQVPNPKAARVVLSVFSVLSGVEISLEELDRHAKTMERVMLEAYEKLRSQAQAAGGAETGEAETGDDNGATPDAAATGEPTLDLATRQDIERRFEEARHDPAKAVELKGLLDRLRVFHRYEDRFLDLFRKAE
jgi:proteasome assembly chaperone (PAC2) family protein